MNERKFIYSASKTSTQKLACSHRQMRTVHTTLRTSLSGSFLQTLPQLVTPLKRHLLSPRSCPTPTRSAPSERFGYPPSLISLMVSVDVKHHIYLLSLAPKHTRKHETHPPRVKKEFRLDSNDFGCAGVYFVGGCK